MADKGKLLEEALNWKPTYGQRTRPEKLWRRLMEEPFTKEAKASNLLGTAQVVV